MIHQWRMRGPLQAYVDGELPEATCGVLMEHLRRCEACAATARRLAETDELFAGCRPTPHALMPAASRALLERALAEAGISRGGPGRGFPLLAWGLASTLVVMTSGAAAWWCRGGVQPNHRLVVLNPGSRLPHSRVAPLLITGGLPTVNLRSQEKPPAPVDRSPAKRPALPKRGAPPKDDGPVQTPAPSIGPDGMPRLRAPVRPRYRLCSLPAASWWRDLATTIEASERAAGELAEAQDQSWAVTCAFSGEPSTDRAAADLLASDPQQETGGDGVVLADLSHVSLPPEMMLHAGDELMLLPASGALRTEAAVPSLVALSAPSLLVLVSGEPAPAPVLVTEAPETAPGFARCSAFRTEADGSLSWTQATVMGGEEPQLERVTPGSETQ